VIVSDQVNHATDTGLLPALGSWLSGTRFEDLPEAVSETARRGLLDLFGVTLAAHDTPTAAVVAAHLDANGGAGPSSVIGLGRTTTVDGAAFANAALGHALDFDDVSHTLGGHPTVVIVPAALALAEARGLSGRELLLAYATGVEVETKIARAVNFTHYDKGWHPTATLGTFGAAAAAAKLAGLDADHAATALSLATAFAAGIKSSFGTMAKPLQVGRAAQAGLTAALLAELGASANPEAFEAKQGFGTVFNGAGAFDPSLALASLAAPWDLEDPGLAFKRHACCGGTHAAVDAALLLRDGLGEPERIEVRIHPSRFAHLDRPVLGDDPLEAKFSLQYTVALALLHGRVELGHFTAGALADPALTALVARVDAAPLPPDRTGPERFAAEVSIAYADGSRVEQRLERPIGRTPETRLSDADMEDKFRACAAPVLAAEAVDALAALTWGIEDVDDVTRLTALLRA
jgi:2-methylcitrate dehydratase PrpD